MTQPSPAAVATDRARMLIDVGRYEDAGTAAMDGLRSEPNNATLLGLLAMALDADGFSHDAQRWAERSLAIDPQQAWVHHVRAQAILDGAGDPNDALRSAYTATQLDRTNATYRYTLTRAYLAAGNRADAKIVADSIRGMAPSSPLGPIAEALIEIDRARFLKINWGWAVFAVLITRGLVLVAWAIWWLVLFIRRLGPLRRADDLLLEALRLDPANPHTHAILSVVAQSRFRYVQSVDASLATAAIDAGLVDAEDLARDIVRRTCLAAGSACVFWCAWLPALAGVGSQTVAAVVGMAVGLVGAGGVGWLHWVQTKRLPQGLRRRVQRRWGVPVTACVVAAIAMTIGGATSSGRSTGVAVAAFACGAAVAACAGVLVVQFVAARRGW